ncbi:pyruvate:ferredoxin (flavodoxin) oxidoreductase [Bittarella massiliensis]|uniref:pyruvate:ferredoxin (flavodoxin) oxidoreductase n=1 Tax=Bittarella massiliensis (ex Durand et al. 2017) TaxID=1720313 RepID=UPI00163C5873|nr:pyruvate:ferredoxin (flavodoxin) oxidoreductase [Bittarella massiliensis (ex Durand et al. 2017)]MBC2870836.1 pyruvate:ferredoxin (flavodoxin) oxidoreductase [Bittarella massiliensis (ex Durand et al. 2017)]
MARKTMTMDGNTAAAYAAYPFTEVAAIYPITPSSPMAEVTDRWAAEGRENFFDQPVRVVEMQAEGGAAGAVHGSLAAGALTATYTASQGLLLMLPNLYKMAGELLPGVIHVSARAVASHALSIFGDHSDIYACRQTGAAMLCAQNPQEVMDLAAVAHLSAIVGRVPVIHFFDGFRTSHEIQKVAVWERETLREMVDWEAVDAFRRRALNPERPVLRGSAQNPDVFFQNREASNPFYDAFPQVVEAQMEKVNRAAGTDYHLFDYYGAPDAEQVIVAMGSVCDTAEETVDYLNAQGEKTGVVKVRLYRPFCPDRLVAAIPETVKAISVLDRTKEPGSVGEPLWLDVAAALRESPFAHIPLYSGRYGLGSKDTTPGQIAAVFANGKRGEKPRFTIGIEDDVTHLSLREIELPDTTPQGTVNCKFWGLGSDGTVGANKNAIKIIGDHTDLRVQAYFSYDSKKSGGLTISNLRFGKAPIKSTYLVRKADFVACHNPAYLGRYPMVEDLADGGTFLLNCSWDPEELERHLPAADRRYMAAHNIALYTIDGVKIAREIGLGGRINTILQAAFFKLTEIIPAEEAIGYMKAAAEASYGRKGEQVVAMNQAAIDQGFAAVRRVEVPAHWAQAAGEERDQNSHHAGAEMERYLRDIQDPIAAQRGDSLPVSAFLGREDGTLPQGSAAFEKRGIAVDVSTWVPENCIQCNFCSYVCPHAVIRPAVMSAQELEAAPEGMEAVPMTGMPGLSFAVTISQLDCTGCGSCANVCPGKKGEKALVMRPLDSQREKQPYFDYGQELSPKPEVLEKFKPTTVKGSQFRRPLLEFSGACGGCGETPYAKLVTQLFGERMVIANATGCSSIWGGSYPATPYTVTEEGRGPAWANSLFEDNAEFGYGIYLALDTVRRRQISRVEQLRQQAAGPLAEACERYLSTLEQGAENAAAARALQKALQGEESELAKAILAEEDFLGKKSCWAFGGDGWAYDIGFGGLDHLLASGADVNVLVFDTEVYSNTGGQASKATPTGAVAQFAAAGKEAQKKDLAAMAMSYGSVYVAQVGMGADYNQCVKALVEAESYPGPSLVICYAPCISHGIKGGLVNAQSEIKRAVETGYWQLFRFDPRRRAAGENPFALDSKEPTLTYRDFLEGEIRYTALQKAFPERAEALFERAGAAAGEKYRRLLGLRELYAPKN